MMSACALGGNPGVRLPGNVRPGETETGNANPGMLQALASALSSLSLGGNAYGLSHGHDHYRHEYVEQQRPPVQIEGSILDEEGRASILEAAAEHGSSTVSHE